MNTTNNLSNICVKEYLLGATGCHSFIKEEPRKEPIPNYTSDLKLHKFVTILLMLYIIFAFSILSLTQNL